MIQVVKCDSISEINVNIGDYIPEDFELDISAVDHWYDLELDILTGGPRQLPASTCTDYDRCGGGIARIDAVPEPPAPTGGGGGTTIGPDGEIITTGNAYDLQISYYLYDHLGNTRMVFHTDLDCAGEKLYIPAYVADYYPFGKILREWTTCEVERYLTTYHVELCEIPIESSGKGIKKPAMIIGERGIMIVSWGGF